MNSKDWYRSLKAIVTEDELQEFVKRLAMGAKLFGEEEPLGEVGMSLLATYNGDYKWAGRVTFRVPYNSKDCRDTPDVYVDIDTFLCTAKLRSNTVDNCSEWRDLMTVKFSNVYGKRIWNKLYSRYYPGGREKYECIDELKGA